MDKTLYSKQAKVFADHLRSLRERAGLTQRQLAERLGREHGMVARIELGERRVDFVEVFQVLKVLEVDPVEEAALLMSKMAGQTEIEHRSVCLGVAELESLERVLESFPGTARDSLLEAEGQGKDDLEDDIARLRVVLERSNN